MSLSLSVSQSLSHSVSQSLSLSVSQSLSLSISQSMNLSISQSLCLSVSQSLSLYKIVWGRALGSFWQLIPKSNSSFLVCGPAQLAIRRQPHDPPAFPRF